MQCLRSTQLVLQRVVRQLKLHLERRVEVCIFEGSIRDDTEATCQRGREDTRVADRVGGGGHHRLIAVSHCLAKVDEHRAVCVVAGGDDGDVVRLDAEVRRVLGHKMGHRAAHISHQPRQVLHRVWDAVHEAATRRRMLVAQHHVVQRRHHANGPLAIEVGDLVVAHVSAVLDLRVAPDQRQVLQLHREPPKQLLHVGVLLLARRRQAVQNPHLLRKTLQQPRRFVAVGFVVLEVLDGHALASEARIAHRVLRLEPCRYDEAISTRP